MTFSLQLFSSIMSSSSSKAKKKKTRALQQPNDDDVYEEQILAYRRGLEVQQHLPKYFESFKESSAYPVKRQYTIDWMSKIVRRLPVLLPDTLYLGVRLMDRFMSLNGEFNANVLKYAGITSLVLATKSNSIGGLLGVSNFATLVRESCTEEEIIAFERRILEKVDSIVYTPTSLAFFWTFAKVTHESPTNFEKIVSLGHYLGELALMDVEMIDQLPSLVAASMVFLSRFTLELVPWNKTLQDCSKYAAPQLRSCVNRLHYLQRGLGFEEFQRKCEREPSMMNIYRKDENVGSLSTIERIPEKYFRN